jgi:hypothetical protein
MKDDLYPAVRPVRYSKNRLPELVSMDDVRTRYCGEWVLMRVTAFDQDNLATQGHVVAHGSRKHVDTALAKVSLNTKEGTGHPYYVFSAGPQARTGEELRAALAEAAEKDAIGAWRR